MQRTAAEPVEKGKVPPFSSLPPLREDSVSKSASNNMIKPPNSRRFGWMAVAILLLATVSTALLWINPFAQSRYGDSPRLGFELSQAGGEVDAVSYSSKPDNTPGMLQPSMMLASTPFDGPSETAPAVSESTPSGEMPLDSLESVTQRLKTASQSVAQYVSSAYRIPLKNARQLTGMAIEIGEAKNVDPLLILAVIATESSYNPRARSAAGAEGLMQVMTSLHRSRYEQFGGEEKAFDPYANISVGTDILNDFIQSTGSVRKALKWYSGAANMSSDKGYSAKVLAERHRLAIAASGNTQSAIELSQKQATVPSFSPDKVPESLAFEEWVVVATRDAA